MKKQFVKVVLNGNLRWVDREANYAGWTDNPGWDKYPSLAVWGGMKNTKRCLDIFIHECLHSCDGSAVELLVEKAATKVAGFLWRKGLRYQPENNKLSGVVLRVTWFTIKKTITIMLENSEWDKLKVAVTARDIANALIKVGYRLK